MFIKVIIGAFSATPAGVEHCANCHFYKRLNPLDSYKKSKRFSRNDEPLRSIGDST